MVSARSEARKKILIVFGTRPEVIKLAPVIIEARKNRRALTAVLCATGQHSELAREAMQIFEIEPEHDLAIMKYNQSSNYILSETLKGLDRIIKQERPNMVVVQGDTTSALGAALAAFYHKIPVAHVEAGLRTGHKYSPFPEEMNRVMIDDLADLLFCPTEKAALNLASHPAKLKTVTGNTVVDALEIIRDRLNFQHASISLRKSGNIPKTPLILLTVHRRENFDRVENVCRAVLTILTYYPRATFLWPVHPNPMIKETVMNNGIMEHKRVFTPAPPRYESFLRLINDSVTLILTDSGGIQEEAPSFHVPVLVLRDQTERPEVVEAGAAKLVGTDTDTIVNATCNLLENPDEYAKMANVENPYGDGKAAQRIVSRIIEYET